VLYVNRIVTEKRHRKEKWYQKLQSQRRQQRQCKRRQRQFHQQHGKKREIAKQL